MSVPTPANNTNSGYNTTNNSDSSNNTAESVPSMKKTMHVTTHAVNTDELQTNFVRNVVKTLQSIF